MFFFEKKNPETFVPWRVACHAYAPDDHRGFAEWQCGRGTKKVFNHEGTKRLSRLSTTSLISGKKALLL